MLPFKYVEEELSQALGMREHMALEYAEQPLLNYLIVTSGGNYSSLRQIRKKHPNTCVPKVVWSGRLTQNMLEMQNILVVHWAGEWQHGNHLSSSLWRSFRDQPPPDIRTAAS